MSLYGSLFSGVSGLNAQGSSMGAISDNIANLNTNGYKGSHAHFASLVSSSSRGTSGKYASGGVAVTIAQDVISGGINKATGSATDLAINGGGFFVVTDTLDKDSPIKFTRAGSFDKDDLGNLRNKSGNYLKAWRLDSNGRLPGQVGNENTISSSLPESLEVVNINSISGIVSKTTDISLGINLKASDKNIKGAGDNIEFSPGSKNIGNNEKSIILPDTTADVALNIGDSISFTPSDPGIQYDFIYGGMAISDQLNGASTLNANTSTDVFSANDGDAFSITTTVLGKTETYTYTFKTSSPTESQNQFNSLSSLASAINQSTGLNAKINNNKLYIANIDANNQILFSNVGTNTDFVASLGLQDVAQASNQQRFVTLEDLKNKLNKASGISANIIDPGTNNSKLSFNTENPLSTIAISATGQAASGGNPESTSNTILKHLGINSAQTYEATYNANDANRNLSGKNVIGQYSYNTRVYDALGTGHDLQIAFGKLSANEWAVEIYALNKDDIQTVRDDGQIASGTFSFNGKGILRNISGSIASPININWTNGAEPSNISYNWGNPDNQLSKGITQYDSAYAQHFEENNGVSPGSLNSVKIDDDGYIVAQFSNGRVRKLYQIPLASFVSPNSLQTESFNVFSQSDKSGIFNLSAPKTGSVGKISSSTLEGANVELSDELTKMVIAQRGYEANAKAVKVASEMLQTITQTF
jgi:flagellar hook protein FlgE